MDKTPKPDPIVVPAIVDEQPGIEKEFAEKVAAGRIDAKIQQQKTAIETGLVAAGQDPERVDGILSKLVRRIKPTLALGAHNQIWYFGFTLENGQDAVITSNREILVDCERKVKVPILDGDGNPTRRSEIKIIGKNEIQETLKIKFPTKMPINVPNGITGDAIKEYLAKVELPTTKTIADHRTLFETYMDAPQVYYDIALTYVVLSYCYPIFTTCPILHIYGHSETGKSKFAKIIAWSSFNGIAASNISEAALFRMIDQTRGTAWLDEYEETESKNKSEHKQILDQLMNAGIDPAASVYRIEKDSKGNQTLTPFSVFCPKIVSNVSGLQRRTTASRSIVLHMLKTPTGKGKLQPEETDPRFLKIRSDIYKFVLDNWALIKSTKETLLKTNDLNNRARDIYLPLLTIAKVLDEKIYSRILEFAKTQVKRRDEHDIDERKELILLESIYDHIIQTPADWLTIRHVSNYAPEEQRNYYADKETKEVNEINLSRWVGRQLDKFRIDHRNIKVEGKKQSEWYIDAEEIYSILMANGVTVPRPPRYTDMLEEDIDGTIEDTLFGGAVALPVQAEPQTPPVMSEAEKFEATILKDPEEIQ